MDARDNQFGRSGRMKVRRVVTGHTPDGKATVASEYRVVAITLGLLPGTEFYRLWGADEAPTFPDDGCAPTLIG
jgi:hypothetical protein